MHGGAAADAVVAAVASAVQAGATLNAMQILADVDRSLALAYGGQTTAVIVEVTPTTIRGASVGDSQAWIVREDSFVDLTESQHAKPLIGSGRATPTVLTNTAPLDGTLVIATDGVFKYAKVEQLCDAALDSNIHTIPAALIDLARLPNGKLQDDAAVILCR